MADKTFFVDIVSPAKQIFSGSASSLSAPGSEGNFQILFNHADFLTSLTYGEIKIITEDGTVTHYATSGGFLEVKNNKVIILAETIEKSNEIDISRSLEKMKSMRSLLDVKSKEITPEQIRDSISKAQNRLKIAEKYAK